jgi:hypothetical protein
MGSQLPERGKAQPNFLRLARNETVTYRHPEAKPKDLVLQDYE